MDNVTPINAGADRLLSVEEVADQLGMAVQTLYRWRSEGHDMPQAFKVGRNLRWKQSVVDAWIEKLAAVAA